MFRKPTSQGGDKRPAASDTKGTSGRKGDPTWSDAVDVQGESDWAEITGDSSSERRVKAAALERQRDRDQRKRPLSIAERLMMAKKAENGGGGGGRDRHERERVEAASRLARPNRPKIRKREVTIDHPLLLELEEDRPGAKPQRGSIGVEKLEIARRQLAFADAIRKSIAPDISLDLPIPRDKAAVARAERLVERLVERHGLPPGVRHATFQQAVIDEVFDYGPIAPLIEDGAITEVMVNGPYIVFMEVDGMLLESGFKFASDSHVVRIIKRIVLPLGRDVSQHNPLIDARLPDGSRVNAAIRPCTVDGPGLTIRKFSKEKLTIDNLLEFGSLTPEMAKFLEALVVARQNIIVSGGTGSGKTTLINCLSGYIPDDDRVVTVEDACELQLKQRNVVRLETKKPSPESPTTVTIRDCVVNALRMRPERIIVGECRAGEALDMLQAMNTGHDGSMTTVHSNDPRACISRVETLCLMAGVDLPVIVVRRQLVSAINWIVQASRLRDGSRKITHITEVERLEGEVPILNDVFRYVERFNKAKGKVEGYHTATGTRPTCEHLLRREGFDFPPNMFRKISPPV